jgi:hypothetical protein
MKGHKVYCSESKRPPVIQSTFYEKNQILREVDENEKIVYSSSSKSGKTKALEKLLGLIKDDLGSVDELVS